MKLVQTGHNVLTVRLVRYRRLRTIESWFKTRDDIQDMTPAQAQKVIHLSLFYETPTTMHLGTQVALFKVWGIPTIAKILLKAGELSSQESLSKRLADTGILVATWITNPIVGPGSGAESYDAGSYENVDPRGAIAVARVNWLHRKYPINQDDYRYNLALFVLEPIDCTARFGWRSHSIIEQQAFYVFWMEIGRRMGIDIPWASLDEMREWATAYEEERMVPNEHSVEIGQIGVEHFSSRLPKVLRPAGLNLVATLLGPNTRRAMRLPDPPSWFSHVLFALFRLQNVFVRYACLPRRSPALWVSSYEPSAEDLARLVAAGELPRIPAVFKRSSPWYYPELKGFQKNIQDVLVFLKLRKPESVPSKRWKSEGYRVEELGPLRFEHQGHEEVIRMAEEIQGGPVKGPWSLNDRKMAS
ncbi:unnamed protein product [Somion occarium]|uniref:ER-bound oxygenase mpaB/mpaB'/Rubber oxygenase catalytic domain-containing protein n=1 Tax=Somion occarium TaxID=3059160 RepID=A0ABP1E5N1_9APHY